MALTAADLIRHLGLAPLAGEGGWFRRTSIDAHSSAILFLLTTQDVADVPGAFAQRSILHRLPGKEIWHFHAGAPVRMLRLDPSTGTADQPVLGRDLAGGEVPQVVVAGGVWQGVWTGGPWSLVGTTMAPPYADADFTVADRHELTARWPDRADEIRELT